MTLFYIFLCNADIVSAFQNTFRTHSVFLSLWQFCKMLVFLFTSAVAPDFSNSVLKAQTLARQGGDVLIECRPRMSPRGMISWRKGKEALRESHRYFYQPISLCLFIKVIQTEQYDSGQTEVCYWSKVIHIKPSQHNSRCICMYFILKRKKTPFSQHRITSKVLEQSTNLWSLKLFYKLFEFSRKFSPPNVVVQH